MPVLGRHRPVPVRQAAGAGQVRLAADRRRRHGADAGAAGAAGRGDRLAADGGAGAAAQAGGGVEIAAGRDSSRKSLAPGRHLVESAMSLASAPLPTDPEALRTFAAELQAELARKDIEIAANAAEIHAKTLHIEKLKMQLAVLRRARFGRSSEKLDRDIEQLELLIGELEEDAGRGRRPRRGRSGPAGSRRPAGASAGTRSASRCRRICRARPSPTSRPAPARAAAAPCSAGSARTSARCSNTCPSSFKVIRHVRPKLSCRACETIVQAPMPSLPIERGRPGPGLVAHVLVSKFCDHTAAAPPERRSTPAKASTRPRHPGRLGRTGGVPARAPGRGDRPPCPRRRRAARRRHDRPGAGARPGQDQDRAALGAGARRAALGFGRAAGRVLPLLGRPQGRCMPRRCSARCRGFLHADGYAGFDRLYQPTHADRRRRRWSRSRAGAMRGASSTTCTTPPPRRSRWRRCSRSRRCSPSRAASAGNRRIAALAARQEHARPLLDQLKAFLDASLARISGKSTLAQAIRYARRAGRR